MTVGEKIRKRRIELEMTQDELAKRCGYKSRSSIQKIESSRNLPLSKVKRVAECLDLSVAYLMGWEDVKGYNFETQEIEREPGIHIVYADGTSKNIGNFYIDEETQKMMEFLHKNPEYQVLFDASSKVKPEDIKKALKALGIFIDEE